MFRATLRTAQNSELPTLKTASRQMSLSTRTLQRRLEEHQTTWSQELQALRREHTFRLLTMTGLSLSSIADRVGYADTGGLRRAVQRWTGQPVSAVRDHHAHHHTAKPPTARHNT
ncbi:helix-turn-helix domain-containing protein [Streptomyces sp. NPDC005899]|uniref:helix-turn-helix domain-containing protein n=1 Tax=Streptomyces sp. NPDC005899 TaxID=3155716 RepID=UPI0033F62D19